MSRTAEYSAKELLSLSHAFVKTLENSIEGMACRLSKFWNDVADNYHELKNSRMNMMTGNKSMLGTMNEAYFLQVLLQYFYHLILLHPCNRSGLSLYNHMSTNSNH